MNKIQKILGLAALALPVAACNKHLSSIHLLSEDLAVVSREMPVEALLETQVNLLTQEQATRALQHGVFYFGPNDSNEKINVQVGDMIIFRTKIYRVVPDFIDGKVETKITGDRTLEFITQYQEGPPTNFNTPLEMIEGVPEDEIGDFAPSALLFAREKGTSNVTIKFSDKDGKELEKTQYKVEVSRPKKAENK